MTQLEYNRHMLYESKLLAQEAAVNVRELKVLIS
jgi:hypothetical protein